jgi:hypothetical protein
MCKRSLPLPVLALVLLTGCQATMRHATTQPAVPRTGNAELVMYISDQPYLTAETAYRAAHLLAKGTPFDGDFDALASTLRSAGLIARHWRHTSDQYLDRGAVGFVICRACRIRSGVNWTLTGLGRYAWRELQYKGIAGGGGEYGLMSGGEFVGLLSRAEDYLRRTGKADVPPVELGAPGG